MKAFSHLKRLNGLKVSRKALRHYAVYRNAGKQMDVSLPALIAFHHYEALGVLPKGMTGFTEFCKQNGYAYGKWMMKLTQVSIFEDLDRGNIVKAEFMNSHHLEETFGYRPSIFKYSRTNWFWHNCIKNFSTGTIPFWLRNNQLHNNHIS